MPFMKETAWAVCTTARCYWGASGPNAWDAAVWHEEDAPGHSVEVGSGGFAAPGTIHEIPRGDQ